MSDAHTPGLLRVGIPLAGASDEVNQKKLSAIYTRQFADFDAAFECIAEVGGADGCPANARRLVAAWNACDGIETPFLEGWAAVLTERPNWEQRIDELDALARQFAALKAQRDELLSLLKRYVEMDRETVLTANGLYRSSVEAINKVEQQ